VNSQAVTQVRALEQLWADAIGSCKMDVLGQMLGDDLTFVHATGVLDTKKGYLEKALANGIERAEIRPDSVRVHGDVAVVNGTLRLKFKGKEMSGWIVYTRVYVRRPSGWELIANHGTDCPR
jgi:ketosteroid isomerase-like protein